MQIAMTGLGRMGANMVRRRVTSNPTISHKVINDSTAYDAAINNPAGQALAAPLTINAVPEPTLKAFADAKSCNELFDVISSEIGH